jgi:hypothetical protein
MATMRTALFAAAFSLLSVSVAQAHFHLNEPRRPRPGNERQTQKTAPCGGAGTASGVVTT